MGGSDLNAVEPYTYDDAEFEVFGMTQFSIAKDMDFTIPLLKLVLQVNPWSPPAWMKNPQNLHGGSLKQEVQHFDALAEYFIRVFQAYAKEEIVIDAITTQNEPDHATIGYPTMFSETERSHERSLRSKILGTWDQH